MKILLCLILIISAVNLFGQNEINLKSKVVDVTVFKDRALVTREANKNLSKGEYVLVFSGMTQDLQDESVRISASGPGVIKILDVKEVINLSSFDEFDWTS